MSDDSCDHTADDFATFFTDKVDSVRASTMSTPPYDVPYRSTPTLDKWTPVTTDEVEKLIGSSSCKTCQLDPVPTWLVKDMKALMSPFIRAVVRPLLKKGGLDTSQRKNYRPVSNLSFHSVIGESCTEATAGVFGQQQPHAGDNQPIASITAPKRL